MLHHFLIDMNPTGRALHSAHDWKWKTVRWIDVDAVSEACTAESRYAHCCGIPTKAHMTGKGSAAREKRLKDRCFDEESCENISRSYARS